MAGHLERDLGLHGDRRRRNPASISEGQCVRKAAVTTADLLVGLNALAQASNVIPGWQRQAG